MRLTSAAPALLAIVACASSASAASWSGNVDLLGGIKYSERQDFGDANDFGEVGVQLDIGNEDWRVRPAVNLLLSHSKDSAGDVKNDVGELQIGVRWYCEPWATVPLRFSVGLGFEVTAIRQEVAGVVTSRDHDFGVWASFGAQFTFANHFHIGPQVGLSASKAEVAGDDKNIGGLHFSLVAGYHW